MPSLHRDLTRDLLFNMADETERNRLVAEFAGVTDVNPERAQFYLESSGWDLNVSNLVYFLESVLGFVCLKSSKISLLQTTSFFDCQF